MEMVSTAHNPLIYKSEVYTLVETSIEFDPPVFNTLYGVNGDWEAMPREINKIDDTTYSVDLDNSGGEEEIITFIKRDVLEADNFVYEMIVKNSSVVLSGGELHVSESEINSPSIRVYALDLNGDDKLELCISTLVSYGGADSIYEYSNNELRNIVTLYGGN